MEETKFYESVYLSMHEDVRDGIKKGYFKTGHEHYCRYGKAEGRKTSPFEHLTHSIADYSKLVRELIAAHPDNYDLAMAKAVGALTLDIYKESGDKHVAILKRFGLKDGQAIYDLACGSGRTAMALKRHAWVGQYLGADIIPELIEYAQAKNPDFQFVIHPGFSIYAPDNSQDMIYAWSLFTHLQLEEIFLYARDCHRALKYGGVFVFSFLTLRNRLHRENFIRRATAASTGLPNVHLDTFLEKEAICIMFVEMLGFKLIEFIDADDETATPTGSFGQSLAVFRK